MVRPKLTPVIVLLLATITVSMTQTSSEPPATNKTLKCPRVGYQYFFKNLNQSVTYRVEVMPGRPVDGDATTGYLNASFSFVRTPHSAFLVFNCERPEGGTCDVYTAWRDFDTGDLRAIRSELDLDGMRPDLEYAFGIEKQGGLYYWCDPERRHRSRFKLVPVVGGRANASSIGTEVCSADYGSNHGATAKQCDLRYLEQIMIHNDLWATRGFNKRALLMSIVLVALIGMTLIAIVMAQWMNKRERLVGVK